MGIQDIIVFAILALALGYAAWRIARTFKRSFKNGSDCCYDCDTCPKKRKLHND